MKQDNNKKIAIMQPYFFPYIGYWQLINTVDEFIIFDDVNYIKRGWINRNYILLNGKKYRIGLNIKDVSQNRLIKDTYLAQSYKDTNKLLASIFHAYNKASYFYDVYPILQKILNTKSNRIVDVLTKQIEEVCKYGPLLEKNKNFPKGTNVNFVKIEDNNNIIVSTWERGCGYTLGCGTGMTASAIICNYLGKVNKSVNAKSEGGCVKIDIDDFVYMTGPAVKICEGTLEV